MYFILLFRVLFDPASFGCYTAINVLFVVTYSDDYESDSNGAVSEDDIRPQTKEELMSRAMKSVVKRESTMRRQDHFELSDVPDRAKKDRLHKQQKAIKA